MGTVIIAERPPVKSETGGRKDYAARVRLFGQVEIETEMGRVVEARKGDSKPWLLIKYLLLRRPARVSLRELTETVFPASAQSDIRVYLFRARRELDPIGLGGKKGLIAYGDGCFYVNPAYELHADLERFETLTEEARRCGEDAEGLRLCVRALELYRGALMSGTAAAWIDAKRQECRDSFRWLLETALRLSGDLGAKEALPLLFRRVTELAPDNAQLLRAVESCRQAADQMPETAAGMPLRIDPTGAGETKLPPNRLGQWKANRTAPADNNVCVELFGDLKLENSMGCYMERAGKHGKPVLLLKFLLLNPGRAISCDQLPPELFADGADGERKYNALRVQLSRIREELACMGLSGERGLILFRGGLLQLNPDYALQIDADRFVKLVERLKECPADDPRGLILCGEALTLYRGKLLEHTSSAKWLRERQDDYQRVFKELAADTLKRSCVLQDGRVLDILCRRTAAFCPEGETLHREIIRCLMDFAMAKEMTAYIAQLVRTGKAIWLEKEIAR